MCRLRWVAAVTAAGAPPYTNSQNTVMSVTALCGEVGVNQENPFAVHSRRGPSSSSCRPMRRYWHASTDRNSSGVYRRRKSRRTEFIPNLKADLGTFNKVRVDKDRAEFDEFTTGNAISKLTFCFAPPTGACLHANAEDAVAPRGMRTLQGGRRGDRLRIPPGPPHKPANVLGKGLAPVKQKGERPSA